MRTLKPASGCILFILLVISIPTLASPAIAAGHTTLLQPGDLVYKGAFRLPAEGDGWSYGGGGLTYYPTGDPGGRADGHPGSLYGIGNDQLSEVSEISIPAPGMSTGRNLNDLSTAATLQPFTPLFSGIFRPADDGLPRRADIAYLPPQAGQDTGHLYMTWGEHYQYEQVPSHAMSRLDMKDPRVKGPWYLADYENYATDDYLFAIPQDWAAQHTPGLLLATGRFRDGSLGGSGPALFAFGPWNEGNPPASRARLTRVVPLLLYGKGYEQDGSGKVMDGYTSADEWTGGEWLTAGEKSAVVFAGTRGRGNFWYGFSNGVIWPDNPPYPEYPPAPHNDRGWWADSFEGVLLFYNPADLAKVALGTMAPHEPQPYGEMKIDQYLWHISGPVQKMHVGDVAFDRERRYLYLVEPFADGDQPIIHVFALTPSPDSGATVNTPAGMMATAPASRLKGTRSQQPAAPSQAVQNPGGDEPVTRVPGFTLAFAIAGAAVVLLLKRNGY